MDAFGQNYAPDFIVANLLLAHSHHLAMCNQPLVGLYNRSKGHSAHLKESNNIVLLVWYLRHGVSAEDIHFELKSCCSIDWAVCKANASCDG